MDWTPTSTARAFQPRSFEPDMSGFASPPDNPKASPFWFRVPAAPITPAARLRNPMNRPTLKVASEEVKRNFFDSVTGRTDATVAGELQSSDAAIKSFKTKPPKHSIEFAQAKFFPPEDRRDSLSDTGLIGLFDKTFSLGTESVEKPEASSAATANPPHRTATRYQHITTSLVLFLCLLGWRYNISYSSEQFTAIAIGILCIAALVAAQSAADSIAWRLKQDASTLSWALPLAPLVAQIGMIIYVVQDIYVDDNNGTGALEYAGVLLLTGTLVQQICIGIATW